MSEIADRIRRDFASAWGEIGAAWGIAPSTAAVQGYFLTHGGPLTEPEIRRALQLSHRAASLALAECEAWGFIERSAAPRRSGQRGPAAVAYVVVGDNWEWFRRVAAARQEREAGPGRAGHRSLRGTGARRRRRASGRPRAGRPR